MEPLLNETTSNLISLVLFYQEVSEDNKKIGFAVDSSQRLTMEGTATSSAKKKLQFCSDAVEAIASVVEDHKVKTHKAEHNASTLNREEIDFIKEVASTNHPDNTEHVKEMKQ